MEVVAVHFNEVGTPYDYVKEHGYTFRMIPDGRAIVEAYGVKKIPTIIVVSPSGDIVHSQVGFAEGDEAKVVSAVEATMAD